jgi:hypothetical protein
VPEDRHVRLGRGPEVVERLHEPVGGLGHHGPALGVRAACGGARGTLQGGSSDCIMLHWRVIKVGGLGWGLGYVLDAPRQQVTQVGSPAKSAL